MQLNTVTYVPVMSASPDYVAGDTIGTYSVLRLNTTRYKVQSVVVTDKAGQAPPIRLLFLASEPAGTFTDNAAAAPSAADIVATVGQVKVQTADYETFGAYKVAALSGINQVFSGTVWVVAVADGAYNGASTSDLTITVGLEVS